MRSWSRFVRVRVRVRVSSRPLCDVLAPDVSVAEWVMVKVRVMVTVR